MARRAAIGTKSCRSGQVEMTPEERIEYFVTISTNILAQLKELSALHEQIRQAQKPAHQSTVQKIKPAKPAKVNKPTFLLH